MPTRNYFFRLALTTFGVQQQTLKGMAVPPADVTLLRTAAPTGPTRLLGWANTTSDQRMVNEAGA